MTAFPPSEGNSDRGHQPPDDTSLHLVTSDHDPVGQHVHITHGLADDHGVRRYPVTLRYAWPSELDLMASHAGLGLVKRTGGWDRQPHTADTTDHVSVYENDRPSTSSHPG